jgi:hypothetical protein
MQVTIKKYTPVLLYLLFVGIVFLTHTQIVHADCTTDVTTPCTIQNLFSLAPVILGAFIAISIVVFFFMIIVSGFIFITAGGDAKRIESGRKSLLYSIIGFALVFFPFIAFQLIGQFTQINTGFSVGPNGTISIKVNSTYTATPLPSNEVNTLTPTPVLNTYQPSNKIYNIELNDNDCYVAYADNGTVIIDQYGLIPINQTGNKNTPYCQAFGQYSNVNDAINYGWEACSAGSVASVTSTWINRAGLSPIISMEDSVTAEIAVGGLAAVGTGGYGAGYLFSGNGPPTYIFQHMLDAANLIMQKRYKDAFTFHGYGMVGSNSAANFKRVATAVDAGYPVIVGMPDHWLTILDVDYASNTITNADTGGLTAWGEYGKGVSNGDGTQSTSPIASFISQWTGYAFILEPTDQNEQL